MKNKDNRVMLPVMVKILIYNKTQDKICKKSRNSDTLTQTDALAKY